MNAKKELVPLPDGLLETLAAVDHEMAAVLLELYVLHRAQTDRLAGRVWSALQLSKQLKAVQKKLERRRAACGGEDSDG